MNQWSAPVLAGRLPEWIWSQVNEKARLFEGKRLTVTVSRKKKQRSGSQNRYYWGVVIPLVRSALEEYGNKLDDEEVHCFLRAHVGKMKRVVVMPDGELKTILLSSTKLTTEEFMDYVASITAWGVEYGISIPQPNGMRGYE